MVVAITTQVLSLWLLSTSDSFTHHATQVSVELLPNHVIFHCLCAYSQNKNPVGSGATILWEWNASAISTHAATHPQHGTTTNSHHGNATVTYRDASNLHREVVATAGVHAS